MDLPFPRISDLSFEWTLYFIVGAMVSWRLRDVVFKTTPTRPLIGLDWGILAGSLVYYAPMVIAFCRKLLA